MVITEAVHQHVLKIPASAWTPAVETSGEVRDGAWVAELTGDLLDGWAKGMRLIVRKERPHPGAQLRITDADGMRITCFATNTPDRPIAELELRHRLRARAEDRIRAARSTGLRNLPLHDTAQNRVWPEIVQIALDLLAWMPVLALTGRARLWGTAPPAAPPVLRGRLQSVTTGRRRILRLAHHWPWTREITDALERLALLPNPG
ncbi:IS1380 family transposase OS=Streptomyces aurantiogriseus OX=66870 GN=GCM10010251_97380 PE=4 SV=1 [Streptomyces aurantiogriseus]